MLKHTQPSVVRTTLTFAAALALLLAACSPPAAEPTAESLPTAAVSTEAPEVQPTEPAAEPTEAPAGDGSEAPTEPAVEAGSEIRLVLSPEGNTARYLVNEQLANVDFPSDAIGETTSISGQIVLTSDGQLVADESKFTVELGTLRSDHDMRDGFVQRNTLQTGQFPVAEFMPTEIIGLPTPLPTSGDVSFQLVGDMVIRGVSRPITWDVTGTVSNQEFTGQATAAFTFADFGLEIPRVARVLSVEDNIRLQYDFHLVPDSTAGL